MTSPSKVCHPVTLLYLPRMANRAELSDDHLSDIIEMALSDHVSFATIEAEYGLSEKQVKALMRQAR